MRIYRLPRIENPNFPYSSARCLVHTAQHRELENPNIMADTVCQLVRPNIDVEATYDSTTR